MTLKVKPSDTGRAQLLIENEAWVRELGIRIFRNGSWLRDGEGIIAGGWNEERGHDRNGDFRLYRRDYSLAGATLVTLDIRAYSNIVIIEATLPHGITGISQKDLFTASGLFLPYFTFSPHRSFFLTTFGLNGGDDEYPGGYWPTAKIGRGVDELPTEAFAPLVLFGDKAALAVAPGNFFLTSPLVKTANGVGRGLHGAVDSLPPGIKLETVFAFGKDVPAALIRLGDLLLARSGKHRLKPDSHPLFSHLGWWNAYGGYYTEPIRRLDAAGLAAVIDGMNAQGIPFGYLGLDLWYPYEEIGRALRYSPDPKKYPEGIGEIAQSAGLSTVLHLSALSAHNAYGTDGADPSFYKDVAKELSHERAIVAWHDWLRTQQHLSPKLRKDPEAAEHWFAGMAEAFGKEGIDVLICMQTMGMNLASTQHPNVVAGRVHTDYLFSQPAALAEAARRGHPQFQAGFIPARELHRQNLLMGMVLYSLGMMPFHDLFLSRPSPDLGGDHPKEEAILRALSCGPVGIGDGPGMVDEKLIDRLLLSDGTLAQPDRPPFPVTETIDHDIEAFWTERKAGSARWIYLLLLNTASEELPFSLDPPTEGEFMIWDGLENQGRKAIEGRLAPGRLAYFVLVPQREGIAPLGLWKRFVPAPTGKILNLKWEEGWQITLDGVEDEFAIFSEQPVSVHTDRGVPLGLSHRGDLWICKVEEQVRSLHVFRR